MTFYFLILFGLYFVMLVVLRIGWSRAVVQKKVNPAYKNFFISVVIPVRNERGNIETLLKGLSTQNYPSSNFEVILVDDHSMDGSVQWVEGGALQNLTVLVLDENEHGKKAALARGINRSKGNIIATTDADCLLPPDWLTTINSFFQNDQINLAAGMVAVAGERDFFSHWQAMEFASVMGTGVAAFGLNCPIMCNGANLSFRKEVFQRVGGYEGNDHIASGDDEFLMRKILDRYPGSVQLLNSSQATAITQPHVLLGDFFQQRIRWASKWKVNPLMRVKLLAIFIFGIQASWIFFLVTSFEYDFTLVLGIVTLKLSADLLFLLPVFKFMKIKFRVLPFFGLQFLYPFYVIFVGLWAPWMGYRWKNRKIL